MPADLVPSEAIPERAARIDSPAMLRVLRLLQQRGFLQKGMDVDEELAGILKRLADLGLVDPAYAGPADGEPFVWVRNSNGDRVLKHFVTARRYEVRVNPRARTALDSLSEAEREAVWAALDWLLIREPGSWPADQAVRLSPDRPAYLLKVLPDLRAFLVVLAPGAVELSDIVREETLRLFLERYRGGAKVG
jgi:hypothetical protein